MYCTPGADNSNLISTEKAVPIKPENNENIKYNVPISFALDDKNHLSCHSVGFFKSIKELLLYVENCLFILPSKGDNFSTFFCKHIKKIYIHNKHMFILQNNYISNIKKKYYRNYIYIHYK